MLYHASPVVGLTVLQPHISNHGVPMLYFSQKRENTLVYLSNAVEKFCRETGFAYDGPWQNGGPTALPPTAASGWRNTTPVRWRKPMPGSAATSTPRKR